MLLVASSTDRHALEKTRMFFFINFCKKQLLRLNVTKFDLMEIEAPRQRRQILYHSNYPIVVYSLKVRCSIVILRYRIHMELKHTLDLSSCVVKLVK